MNTERLEQLRLALKEADGNGVSHLDVLYYSTPCFAALPGDIERNWVVCVASWAGYACLYHSFQESGLRLKMKLPYGKGLWTAVYPDSTDEFRSLSEAGAEVLYPVYKTFIHHEAVKKFFRLSTNDYVSLWRNEFDDSCPTSFSSAVDRLRRLLQ